MTLHLVLPTVDVATRNILSVYRAASVDDFIDGFDWYNRAYTFAASLDNDPIQAAGVIAALSPMNEWNNNKAKAAALYAAKGVAPIAADGSNGYGLSKNLAKAIRIYNGEKPMDVLRGPKVIPFFETIAYPDKDFAPVIDRHAFDIAVNMRTDDATRAALSRKAVQALFSEAYVNAANEADILVKQMQAITWVSWKSIHGIK